MQAGAFPLFIAEWVWMMTFHLVERSVTLASFLQRKEIQIEKNHTNLDSLEQLWKSKRENICQ